MADECIMVTGENEKRTYSGAMEYCSGLGAGLASPTNLMALRNYVLLELGECAEARDVNGKGGDGQGKT